MEEIGYQVLDFLWEYPIALILSGVGACCTTGAALRITDTFSHSVLLGAAALVIVVLSLTGFFGG